MTITNQASSIDGGAFSDSALLRSDASKVTPFKAALFGLAALCAPLPVQAQTPDRSIDFYQDWLLNCAAQRTGDIAPAPAPEPAAAPGSASAPAPAAKPGAKPAAATAIAASPAAATNAAAKPNTICEMVQTFRNRTNNQVIAIVALGKPEPGAERKFVIQVPVGVWLPDGISQTTEKTSVAGQYLRCSPTVCIAQADAKKEVLDALKAGALTSLQFSDAGRTRARLTISGKGFTDALAALDKRS